MKKDPAWYSNYSFLALGIVLITVAVISLCQDLEVSQLLPYLASVFMILLFVISFTWFAFRNKKKINKNPLYGFTLMVYLLIIFTAGLSVISYFEKEEVPDWFFAIFFLTVSMSIIHGVFKHMQKRIDALEEKLNEQNQSEE